LGVLVFRKLFGGGTPKSPAYEAGQQLFQQGMKAASEYRTAEAMVLYTKSFVANPNPAPLINRAKLYRWRLLFEEAIRDLEIAMRLDKQQGDQFSMPLGKELQECKFLAQHRLGGKRDLFVTDLQSKGFDYVAGRIADSVFEGDGQLLGYHMVNEVDNVKKFESLPDFPSAKTLLANWMKDQSVIDQALANPTISGEYQEKRMIFETMVCVYDYADMAKMRDTIIRMIWCLLNPPSQMQALWEVGLRDPH
jgi:tetratricopeptide (TPR) repeat protein